MPEAAPTTTGRRAKAWLSLALVAAGAVTAIAGCTALDRGRDDPGAGMIGHRGALSSASPDVGTGARPALAPPVPGEPVEVRIPALGVDARVLPVHAPNDTLVPPSDPQELGWWSDGAAPGAGRGTVLIAGHTVHDGPGALNQLGTLPTGAPVTVRTATGERLRYRARRARTFAKHTIATEAARLFTQTGPERLVLVTCADWNGTRYLSNTVVIAAPVPR